MSKQNGALKFAICETCKGWVGVVGSSAGLQMVILPLKSKTELLVRISTMGGQAANSDSDSLANLTGRIKRYFAGEMIDFDDKLDLTGTDFQQKVWSEVRRIPRGQSRSYSWVASRVGSPKAARAVGQVMARNPVPIVVPCHRVVRENGKPGGFGGGSEMKKFLLHLEQSA